jgi:uncharacterized protein YxeA
MDKKIIIIILFVILVFMIGGIFVFSNKNNEKTNDINSNIENKKTNVENTENLNEQKDDLNQNTEITSSNQSEDKTNTLVYEKNNKGSIVAEASPSGFMGSSSYKVILYYNREVYVKKFDGNGYEKENQISEELIAKNVSTIEPAKDEEHYGEVLVKGGEAISNNFGWISFE